MPRTLLAGVAAAILAWAPAASACEWTATTAGAGEPVRLAQATQQGQDKARPARGPELQSSVSNDAVAPPRHSGPDHGGDGPAHGHQADERAGGGTRRQGREVGGAAESGPRARPLPSPSPSRGAAVTLHADPATKAGRRRLRCAGPVCIRRPAHGSMRMIRPASP